MKECCNASLCQITMVRGTKKRRTTRRVRQRRRRQKGGDILRSAIGKSLPLLFGLYGKIFLPCTERLNRLKRYKRHVSRPCLTKSQWCVDPEAERGALPSEKVINDDADNMEVSYPLLYYHCRLWLARLPQRVLLVEGLVMALKKV